MSNKYVITRQDIQEVIKEDSERLSNLAAIDGKNLVLKLSKSQMKRALIVDFETKTLRAEFTPTFINFINDFRKYKLDEAETFSLELDDEADQEVKTAFIKAWKLHFVAHIVHTKKEVDAQKKKLIKFATFGSLIIAIVIVLACVTHFIFLNHMDTYQKTPWFITLYVFSSIFGYGIYVIGWGMIWEMFSNVVGKHKADKKQLVDMFVMYKVNIKFVNKIPKKTNTKS